MMLRRTKKYCRMKKRLMEVEQRTRIIDGGLLRNGREWTNTTKKEAYRQAAEIITADFNFAGGPTHSWGESTDRKIGPCSSRSVSVNHVIYVFLAIEK